MVREEDIRSADFDFRETRISAGGETDVFSAGPESSFEIHILLKPSQVPACRGQMIYDGIRVVSPDGRPVRIIGEDGRALDAEMREVLAWEIVEDHHKSAEYAYGRAPARHASGALAVPGEVIAPARDREGCTIEF
ncbi:hypothetical protein [Defluviimonas salinarum]|uniref:Uncharacterized protein n=1 Tax=Defluviimonas salinarum TaxID=2992147 RepID=A0ABT3J4A7_9RHOB|nr:hypothetical protein [Defluviimonas salinarum]MCW3782526.1 hypothetical protein [Defluviimonas salinarum]